MWARLAASGPTFTQVSESPRASVHSTPSATFASAKFCCRLHRNLTMSARGNRASRPICVYSRHSSVLSRTPQPMSHARTAAVAASRANAPALSQYCHVWLSVPWCQKPELCPLSLEAETRSQQHASSAWVKARSRRRNSVRFSREGTEHNTGNVMLHPA